MLAPYTLSAFLILPTVPHPFPQFWIPHFTFRIPHSAIPHFTNTRLQRLSITQLLLGQVVVPKKTHRTTDERDSNVFRDYADRTFTEFLRAIAHNVRV